MSKRACDCACPLTCSARMPLTFHLSPASASFCSPLFGQMEGVSPTYVSFINHDQLSLTSFDNDSGKGGSVDHNKEENCAGKSAGKGKHLLSGALGFNL